MCKVGKKVTNIAHGNAIWQHCVAETLFKVGAIKASLEQKCYQPCTKVLPTLRKQRTSFELTHNQPCTGTTPWRAEATRHPRGRRPTRSKDTPVTQKRPFLRYASDCGNASNTKLRVFALLAFRQRRRSLTASSGRRGRTGPDWSGKCIRNWPGRRRTGISPGGCGSR